MLGEHGEPLSWDAYCIRFPELLAYEPFVEDVLPGGLDMAFFEFGEQHAGQVLTACDCLSIFDRGTVRRSGLLKQMRILLGWWTVYFPNDWAAVSHYSPGVLVWFLLKHVASLDFNRPRRDFSPLRASIASMAMIPWEQLFVQIEEYGVLGIVLGGFVPRRPVVGINSSGKCDKRCTRLQHSLAWRYGRPGCR